MSLINVGAIHGDKALSDSSAQDQENRNDQRT